MNVKLSVVPTERERLEKLHTLASNLQAFEHAAYTLEVFRNTSLFSLVRVVQNGNNMRRTTSLPSTLDAVIDIELAAKRLAAKGVLTVSEFTFFRECWVRGNVSEDSISKRARMRIAAKCGAEFRRLDLVPRWHYLFDSCGLIAEREAERQKEQAQREKEERIEAGKRKRMRTRDRERAA
jgi:hypothetical protein